MNMITEYGSSYSRTSMKILPGLEGLEAYVDYHTYIYILRALYQLALKSHRLKENKHQFKRRILQFEKQSGLPGFLSSMEIDELLNKLEDAQHLYPMYRYEKPFPNLH